MIQIENFVVEYSENDDFAKCLHETKESMNFWIKSNMIDVKKIMFETVSIDRKTRREVFIVYTVIYNINENE